jgi:hypothetical protein
MSQGIRKLAELFREFHEPHWASLPTLTTASICDAEQEMKIIPETEHGPMLEITERAKDGSAFHSQRLNLAAVDDLIGKLIKMRDHMAQMKGE